MNYIVLDMEWNQAFSPDKMRKFPLPLYGEIIQIGAVKLDASLQMVDTFKILVKPQYYKRMHWHVKKLTGIDDEMLQYGFSFPVALAHFKRWCGEDVEFLTWGPDDLMMLRDNMILHQVDTSALPKAYNIQMLFDAQIAKLGRAVSLNKAMKMLEETPRKAHDALHDAMNTVCVCGHLDFQSTTLASYEVHLEAPELMRLAVIGPVLDHLMLPETYAERKEALRDEAVWRFYSAECGKWIRCVSLVRQTTGRYIALGKGETGEPYFVRLLMKRQENGRVSVGYIVYEWNVYNEAYYYKLKAQHGGKDFDFAHYA